MSRVRISLYSILYAILLTSFLSISYAFIIRGEVYDYYTFDKATNSILMINTSPIIRMVCIDGSYNISLPPGFYTIKVRKFEKGEIVEEGEINISIEEEKGEAQEDILLFPVENSSLDVEELDYASVSESYFTPTTRNLWIYFLLLLSLFLIYLLVYFWLKKRIKRKEIVMDENMSKLIALLKKEKRINQKDIKKEIKLSDAKISLMIAELEERGIIKKIKKGRGNIIIYRE